MLLRRRSKHIVVIVILLLLALAGGAVFVQRYNAAARRREQQLAARLYTVVRGDLRVRLLADGTAQVPLLRQRFAVAGTLAQLFVKNGDIVESGQLLARLDDSEYRARVRDAELRLREATVRLERSRQAYDQQLQSELIRVQSLQYQLETEETRYFAMLEVKEAFTAQELELRRLAWQNSKASYQQALANYQRLLDQGGQFALEELAVEQARTAYNAALASLDAASLYAARAGKIMSLPFAVGDTVSVTTDFVSIGDPENVRVTANISELDISSLFLGQQASVEFDALAGLVHSAELIAIEPLSVRTGNLVNYSVTLQVQDPAANLRPGMSATITFLLGEVQDVLLLPAAAIRTASDGVTRVVDLRRADGGFTARPVVLGLSDGRLIEIVEGLSAGDRVLIR